MFVSESVFSDPKGQQVEETPELSRARKILAAYYIGLPFALIYLLFKVFPPPWPSTTDKITNKVLLVELQQICFWFGRLCVGTSLEERLLFLVIVAGALGSYIHSATSYTDYRGNRQFNPCPVPSRLRGRFFHEVLFFFSSAKLSCRSRVN